MAEQRPNSGTLGKNRYKEKDNQPDLTGNIHVDRNLLIDMLSKNKDMQLICFCAPSSCHGDIIKEYLEEQLSKIK